MEYNDRGPESGEMLECQSFYFDNGWKLSIGVECEAGDLTDRYDYDAEYLEKGMAYRVLNSTVCRNYVFGIAWIDDVIDKHERDIQTWFAADVTVE